MEHFIPQKKKYKALRIKKNTGGKKNWKEKYNRRKTYTTNERILQ